MRKLWLLGLILACSKAQPVTDATAPPSADCVAARALRSAARDLSHDGRIARALRVIRDANGKCDVERSSSAGLEAELLAELGRCDDAKALEADAGCEAPPNGTEKTMRAKMREAWAAERAGDAARAKALYTGAWAELHTARALEGAARVAASAGEVASSRRLYDRALAFAETAEATAHVEPLYQFGRMGARLYGDIVIVPGTKEVVAYDLKAVTARWLLDVDDHRSVSVSPHGTLALVLTESLSLDAVFDLASGTLVLGKLDADEYGLAPDDSRIVLASRTGHVRVLDTETGNAVATFEAGAEEVSFVGFAPDRDHVVAVVHASSERVFRTWDIAKRPPAMKSVTFSHSPTPFTMGSQHDAAISTNGRYVVIGDAEQHDDALSVRDLSAVPSGTQIAEVSGIRLGKVSSLGVSNDGRTVATGSYQSLRLWDVTKNQQTFRQDINVSDPGMFAFTDDGKSVLYSVRSVQSWEVATGHSATIVADDEVGRANDVAWSPDGATVALALASPLGVRVVLRHGDPRIVSDKSAAKLAFSHDGKTFALVDAENMLHVYDTATWTERAHVQTQSFAYGDPIELGFASNDTAIVVLASRDVRKYDAGTGAELTKVKLAHPTKQLGARSLMFEDGSVAVRVAEGLALFDEGGAYVREEPLPTPVLADAVTGKSTYIAARADAVDVIDLAARTTRTIPVTLSAHPASVSATNHGGTIVLLTRDDHVVQINGSQARALDVRATRVWTVGGAVAVLRSDGKLELHSAGHPVASLTVLREGVLASLSTGAYERRGKGYLVCVAGTTKLDAAACADQAQNDVIDAWFDATR